jgi:hypothetical protein
LANAVTRTCKKKTPDTFLLPLVETEVSSSVASTTFSSSLARAWPMQSRGPAEAAAKEAINKVGAGS